MDAARRKAESERKHVEESEEVVYGDFLLSKVSGNFRY